MIYLFNETLYRLPESSEFLIQIPATPNDLLIVIDEPISTEQKELLGKLLKAINYELESTTIIENTDSKQISFKNLEKSCSFQYLFLFGLRPDQIQMNIQIPPNQPITFRGKTFLSTYSLEQLSDKSNKVVLWNALKKCFNV